MPTQPVTERFVSLDAFRGATMALMVLVNTPGTGQYVYAPLRHAEWHGWTITDVVFPSFLWIVGVAMTFAMARQMAAGATRGRIFGQVCKRAAILYLLGLIVYLFPDFDFSTMRVLGVLQRIAVCYLIAAAIYLSCGVRVQILWIVALLAGYWLLMLQGDFTVEGNFAHSIDHIVLGRHNYGQTKTWDPEGIVSTLPAIATALFGIMAGHILRLKRDLAERTTWLFFAGNLLIAAGLIADIWLPINKKLWTSSFSLFMAGLDFVLLAIFAWWVDGQGHKRMVRPFVIFGMNAITVYMISELLESALGALHLRTRIYETIFAPLASPINASLLFAVSYTLLMYLIAYIMYRRSWFLRV
jgi:predicted acyltransferase